MEIIRQIAQGRKIKEKAIGKLNATRKEIRSTLLDCPENTT